MSSADAKKRRETAIDQTEILILRQISEFSLEEIIGALLFKHGTTKLLSELSSCVTKVAEHYERLAESVAGTTQLAPNTDQRLDDYYQAKAGRLHIIALGLNTVKTHYEISKNEPTDQILAQLELETAQDAIDREAYQQHHINSIQ